MSQIIKDHFVYKVAATALSAGTSQTAVINLEADANFIAVKLSYAADVAGGAQTDSTRVVPLVRISIRDSGSGRLLQNAPISLAAIAGTGELPFVLPIPRKFSASSSIQVTFENYSAGTTYTNVELNFIGYKEFMLGG